MIQSETQNNVEDLLNPVGYLTIEKFNADGKLVDVRRVKNTVVNSGKAFIAGSMIKTTTNSPTAMDHMSIGTGTGAVDVLQTTLGTQVGARVTFVQAASSTTNQVTYKATFGSGHSGAITEAGIFNASTSGTMLCRTVFGIVTKTTSDTITITWTITVS